MHVMLDAMVGTGFETEGCDAEYADVLAMIYRASLTNVDGLLSRGMAWRTW